MVFGKVLDQTVVVIRCRALVGETRLTLRMEVGEKANPVS